LPCILQKLFDAVNGFRSEQNISANGTNFRRHVIDYDNLPSATDRVNNLPFLIHAGASLDATFHGFISLLNGVTHLGGLGS